MQPVVLLPMEDSFRNISGVFGLPSGKVVVHGFVLAHVDDSLSVCHEFDHPRFFRLVEQVVFDLHVDFLGYLDSVVPLLGVHQLLNGHVRIKFSRRWCGRAPGLRPRGVVDKPEPGNLLHNGTMDKSRRLHQIEKRGEKPRTVSGNNRQNPHGNGNSRTDGFRRSTMFRSQSS
uniref:Uncharacterized protein n=1 Tax=Cacopsylla melanoneura TaxID=428564 RepID=A0A8D8QDJ4_9HEMI